MPGGTLSSSVGRAAILVDAELVRESNFHVLSRHCMPR